MTVKPFIATLGAVVKTTRVAHMFTESHSRDAICRRGACMCALLLPPSPFVRARELLLNLESEERWDGA